MQLNTLTSGQTLLSMATTQWDVTLQIFIIAGQIPFELYILTRKSISGKVSELYYFQETAERAFFQCVERYEKGDL